MTCSLYFFFIGMRLNTSNSISAQSERGTVPVCHISGWRRGVPCSAGRRDDDERTRHSDGCRGPVMVIDLLLNHCFNTSTDTATATVEGWGWKRCDADIAWRKQCTRCLFLLCVSLPSTSQLGLQCLAPSYCGDLWLLHYRQWIPCLDIAQL